MKHDEILQAAKKAGGVVLSPRDYGDEVDRLVMKLGSLKRFAAIIEKRTIERCAVVCEQMNDSDWSGNQYAAAIRKLGEQE